jgi:ribose 5-phosphate isomerase A
MIEKAKKSAGEKAVDFIQDHMVVGIGSGSTISYFIEHLGQRCKDGLVIKAVASSFASTKIAQQAGIPLLNPDVVAEIDVMVDGADEIDAEKRMIKGGGGALLREKILAFSSREMVVIVDDTKVVEKLGKGKLPVEILPFAYPLTIQKIQCRGELRKREDGDLFYTDNGNLIYDIEFDCLRKHPEEDHEKLIRIPGVIETGFFFGLAGPILIGHADGTVTIS